MIPDRLKTNGVVAVEESNNSKTGAVSATYVSQRSCPTTCPFFGNGCYAEHNNVGRFILPRLTPEGRTDALILAKREAQAIRELSGKRPLRLHVVGDCRTESAARAVSEACAEHTSKHGQTCYSYTHAWRDVPRSAWGDVSILASCEKVEDLTSAHQLGYAAAMVVDHHESSKAVPLPGGFKGIPCPEQTRGVKCTDCRLCFDAPRLFQSKLAILFAAHGRGENKVKAALKEGAP